MSCSSESVWPELLLQSNIEQVHTANRQMLFIGFGSPPGLRTPLSSQFDKVQESFFSLEQQASTFQAHLEGLGKGNPGGYEGPPAQAKAAQPCSAPKQTGDVSAEHCTSTSETTSASSADTDSKTPLSLRERSALHFSSALGRLRRSGRRK